MKSSRVVRNGSSSVGLVIPALLVAASILLRPTSRANRSAAVLSLMEIMLVAACRTVTFVPGGSFWSSPEGRLLMLSVIVNFSSQRAAPKKWRSPTCPARRA